MPNFGEVKTGLEVIDKLGLLEPVVLKLITNPDKAASRLDLALNELSTGYNAFYNAIIKLSIVSFKSEEINESREFLLKVKDGCIATEIFSVKGSCQKIWNIYQKYLTGWISSVLNKQEASEIEELFLDLQDMDGKFIRAVEQLSSEAQKFAADVLHKINIAQYAEAEYLRNNFEDELAPFRSELTQNIKELWNLQSKLREVAGSV